MKVQPLSNHSEHEPSSNEHRSSKSTFGVQQTSVQVIIRIRPLIEREQKSGEKNCIQVLNNNTSIVIEGKRTKKSKKVERKQFTYDKILTGNCSQHQLFESGPKSIVEKSLQGFNGCIFCYGQTASGKTHTMYGSNDSTENAGIIYQANNYIQEYLKNESSQDIDYKLHVTFLEIYNEQLFDLLQLSANTTKKLKIREDPKTGVYVENIAKIAIEDHQQLEKIIDDGQKRRTTSATEMNAVSSRSHSVLGLHISQQLKKDKQGYSQRDSILYMIDLAVKY